MTKRDQEYLSYYRKMVTIRQFETLAGELFAACKIPGFIHLSIGQATPPVGVNLFTAANLVKGDLDAIAKQAILFVIMDVVILIILSLFPILSLYLPVLAGLYTP